MRRVIAWLICIGCFFSYGLTAQAAVPGSYTNLFYAIRSFEERAYAAYAEQTALGWGEIRRFDGRIYFSQQRITSEYGVPRVGDVPALVQELRDSGTRLTLSVFLNNQGIFRDMLDSPDIQDQIIADMVDAVRAIRWIDYNAPRNPEGFHPHYVVTDALGRTMAYDGLVIDFEDLFDNGSYRQKFNGFLKRLRDQLPPSKTLTVCIPPKRKAPVRYFDGYDYAFIGAIADQVILMAHDYQWGDGSIKATAPLSLVREALEFAVAEIPKNKLLLQVSLAPVLWRNGRLVSHPRPGYGEMMAFLEGRGRDQKRLLYVTPEAERFHPGLQTGYARLRHELAGVGIVEDVFYFENARSIAKKRALAGKFGIRGMSVWRLGLGAAEPMEELLHGRHVRNRVEGFVERLYTIALNRPSEPGGRNFWTDRLITERYTAAYVVQHILLDADEFLKRGLKDEAFIDTAYRTFFNRSADPRGRAFWLEKLREGYSRRWVIANMLTAPTREFQNLCEAVGIQTGQIRTTPADLPRR